MTDHPHRDRDAEPRAWLALENGYVTEGRSVGAAGEATGDVVFNTSMSGYHEILTDPSYAGQVVVMTYPLIGNYGVADEDAESESAWPEAFVIKEMSTIASNFRSEHSLGDWLRDRGVIAIDGVDTRTLTKITRTEGSLRCVVSTTDSDPRSLVAKARACASTDGRDLASEVSCKAPYAWSESIAASYPEHAFDAWDGERLKVVAYDFGIKRNILRSLVHQGFDVTVVPAGTSTKDALAYAPDCIFLSNGPGDPAAVPVQDTIAELADKLPLFGICLGHQILSLVLGAKTHKMPFGHHGANHPVRDILTGRVEITSQNHSFATDPETIRSHVEVTHVNLNDQTIEGIRDKRRPVFSVQYHPEAAPGPLDSAHLFARFRDRALEALGRTPARR